MSHLSFLLVPGMVPEPPSEVAEVGLHEEGPWAAGAQRAPADVLGPTHVRARDAHAREAAARAQDRQADREAAAEGGLITVIIGSAVVAEW